MSDQNKAQIRRVIEEIYNRGDLAIVDELAASDLVIHTSSEEFAGATGPSNTSPPCARGSPTSTSPSRTRSPKATWW